MRFNDAIKLAFSNLKKRKGRTLLTALAIGIGTTLVITMVGLGSTGEKYILDETSKHSNIKKIDVMPKKYVSLDKLIDESDDENLDAEEKAEKSFKKIDDNAFDKMKSLDNIEDISASIFGNISELTIEDKKYTKSVNTIGYKDKIFLDNQIKELQLKDSNFKPIVAGKSLNKDDENGILVSERILNEMGIKDNKSLIGTTCTLTTNKSKNGLNLKPLSIKTTIVGVINEKADVYSGKIVVPFNMASKFRNYVNLDNSSSFENKGYDSITIFAENENAVKTIGDNIAKLGYMYISSESLATQIKSIFNVLKTILSSLGIIVLFVASLGIINTMIMSIYERTKSIGIMKSIGASRSHIKSIFIVESASIGFIGGIMGLAFSLVNSKIIEFAMNAYLERTGDAIIRFYLPNWLLWSSLIFAIAIAILSGLYPSSRAAKLNPIEALNSK